MSRSPIPIDMELQLRRSNWPLRVKLARGVWTIAWHLFGEPGPRFFSAWRVLLLRLFGAQIGANVLICGGVKVLMPWKLKIADSSVVGAGVDLYNFAPIHIGKNTCVSQRVWLCTGTHDYSDKAFPLVSFPITIGDNVWVAAEAFVCPGVTVNDGAVIGARSVVTKDIPAWTVCAGNPCEPIRLRVMKQDQDTGVNVAP